jgi:hypothetical protein
VEGEGVCVREGVGVIEAVRLPLGVTLGVLLRDEEADAVEEALAVMEAVCMESERRNHKQVAARGRTA